MSDSISLKPELKTFVVYAPDRTEEGTLARRYEVRPSHLAGVTPLIEAGIIKVGGMLIDPDFVPTEGQPPKAVGSVLMIKAESLSEVRKLIESDIYYTANVWDSEKLVILPFISATPFP
ncbi:hypothetical protein B0H34DRAFT_795762 [Crassisporium funariophilum]|nr:hypothetical protein B0H34DRAFT_795762 [Crassisporium funariophilum]